MPATTQVLTLIYLTGFILPAKSSNTFTFFVGGNLAYEVQLSVVGPLTEVVLSTFGLDEFGNLVHGQRVLQEEMTVISTLSTSPEPSGSAHSDMRGSLFAGSFLFVCFSMVTRTSNPNRQ